MIILASTSDLIRVVTSAAVALDVHASWMDGLASPTPGRTNTAISTATTTTVIGSPGSGVYRAVKALTIRNKSTTTSVDVTVLHSDGTNVMELYSASLSPGGHLHYNSEVGFYTQTRIVNEADPWAGNIIACQCDGNPNYALNQMLLAGNVAPTPTNIGATVARCELFRPAYDITVNRLRWYGVGAVTAIYTTAIYKWSDLSRVSEQFTLTTAASTWGSVAPAVAFTLTAGTLYFLAVSANTTGTTAGIGSVGGTVAAATGQIAIAPGSLPGNMDMDLALMSTYRFQFAVTAGAMPATAAAPAAQAAWTGGMPMLWLDNNSAA